MNENTDNTVIVPATPTMTFRIKPARSDNAGVVKNVLDALNNDGRCIVVGSALDDTAYNALTETFASEAGTTVLRFSDRTASQLRSAVSYRAKQLERKLSFAPLEAHNGSEWATVAYAVTARTA